MSASFSRSNSAAGMRAIGLPSLAETCRDPAPLFQPALRGDFRYSEMCDTRTYDVDPCRCDPRTRETLPPSLVHPSFCKSRHARALRAQRARAAVHRRSALVRVRRPAHHRTLRRRGRQLGLHESCRRSLSRNVSSHVERTPAALSGAARPRALKAPDRERVRGTMRRLQHWSIRSGIRAPRTSRAPRGCSRPGRARRPPQLYTPRRCTPTARG